jgi:hypothetical protein
MKIATDTVPGPVERILLDLEVDELKEISALPTKIALSRAAGYLTRMVRNREFQEECVLPLLEKARGREGWYVDRSHNDSEGSYSLQVFVWPPGTGTRVHDHTCWGVYCCAAGTVLEDRYRRLDYGILPGYARVQRVWSLRWTAEDGVSTVLPYDGGIHRVRNPDSVSAISVHLYGPQIGEVDGRDYDVSNNYICDRPAA